jgi:neutral ceramidase
MKAGLAQIEITAPVGTPLTGYIARDGVATGVLDPLYAKAMVVDDGAQQLAVLTCDLLGLRLSYVQSVRDAINAATSIPVAHILIACSHTHAGPATIALQDCGEVDESYLTTLRDKLVEVTVQAKVAARPARFAVGHGQLTAGVHNRRQPGDVIDPDLGVLRIDDEAGQTLGIVLNYACHPTCLTGENRLFSAEYCGRAIAAIQRATGATALFLTGAIGDVGPVERGLPVLEQIGEAVAEEALRVLRTLDPAPWRGLRVASEMLSLPLQPLPTIAQMEAEVARWQQTITVADEPLLPAHPMIPVAMRHWSARTLAELRAGVAPQSVQTEVQVIRIGDLLVVSAPGELFVELGLAVKRRAGTTHLFVAGFGNDNIGYIPTRRAYPLGGYEVNEAYKYYGYPAALAPEAGEQYVEAVMQKIHAI